MRVTRAKQKRTTEDLEETISALKQQDLETRMSFCEVLKNLSNIGHSDDKHKNIHMLDLIDKTFDELCKDIETEVFIEKGKIIELAKTGIQH